MLMGPLAVQAQARFPRCSSVRVSPFFVAARCPVLLEHSSNEFMHFPNLFAFVTASGVCQKTAPIPAQEWPDDHSALHLGSPPRPWCIAIRHIGGPPSLRPCKVLPGILHGPPLLKFLAPDGQELSCHQKGPLVEPAVEPQAVHDLTVRLCGFPGLVVADIGRCHQLPGLSSQCPHDSDCSDLKAVIGW